MSSPVICIGATLVDELFFCIQKTVAGTSNPALLKRSAGGVVRNIAHQLALLDVPVQLISALGNDPDGEWLISDCKQNGIAMDAVLTVNATTGKYASILDEDGSLYAAVCSDPCTKYLSPEFLQQQNSLLLTAAMIITDTNIDEAALSWLAEFSRQNNIPLLIDPVSVVKARKLAAIDISGIFMITPNEDELSSVCFGEFQNINAAIESLLQRGVLNIWLRKGEQGSEIFSKGANLQLSVPAINIKDSTGAGDAALAGWAAAYYHGLEPLQCLQAGHTLAMEVLQVQGAIMPGITKEKLFGSIKKYYPNA